MQKEKIYKKLLKKYSVHGKKIYLVDGKSVRDLLDVDFFMGSHDLYSRYIPKGEVWIEKDLNPKEQKLIMLHELTERELMEKGMKYDEAHAVATATEYLFRKNPKFLGRKLSQIV
jgi:hypothetical protein